MKYNKTAKIAILIAAIILISTFVAAPFGPTGGPTNIGATLAYGNVDLSDAVTASGSDSVPAFKLTTPGKAIILTTSAGEINTNQLIFASRTGFRGVYYNDTEKHAYSGDSFRLNGVEYTISRTGTGTASAYRFSSAQSGSLMIGTGASNTLILPDNGLDVKIVLGSIETSKRLPATVVFNSPVAGADVGTAGTRAAGAAGVSGEASGTAVEGCEDADKDADNPSIEPSYVTIISGGTQTNIMDKCVVSGDVTRLHEAVCDGDTAKVEQVVCPEDMSCPIGEGACRRNTEASAKFCEKTDPLTAFNADALIFSTTTKGIMMGSYAATIQTIEVGGETAEVGREFGAWADYCKDSKTLIEYYCTPGNEQRGAFREVICLNGCLDGKCENKPYCYDSDGGAYSSVKGTIRGVNASGQYFNKTDSCKDGNTVIEYRCSTNTGRECKSDEQCTSGNCGDEKLICNPARPGDPPAPYLSNGFVYEELSCDTGKYCNDGKCVSGTAPLCKACDPLNKFNIRQGTACTGATPTAWVLKRCPAGQYCNADNCVPEPKATIAQVTEAFNRRKQWALLLNDTLGWIETAKQITPIIEIAAGRYAGMEQIANGLNSVQTIILQRAITRDIGADIGSGFFGPGGPGL